MSSPSPQPTPPAAETSAAVPGTTPSGQRRHARHPELISRRTDGLEPRPSTLATQELRLALAFTGGVSLAVWMGGVSRELDLLVQASEHRRVVDRLADATTPDADPVRRGYRRLLDLVDMQVAIDVLAGTSAGGINAVLLGLVNARRRDLSELRGIWLSAGDLGALLRDPKEPVPPSLLQGDARMLTQLGAGISTIVGDHAVTADPRRTDVFITTTLLSPETSRFSDDYGTQITDTDHHGQFHFDERSLLRPDVIEPLALAARSSASFPMAFEPSFLPHGPGPDDLDALHPDMADYTDTTQSHWAADGGLLVNRPIAPLLQSIFDRDADRQVRRTLLYVVPSSGSNAAPPPASRSTPPSLPEALLADLKATLNQSIAADLAVLKEHNDRVGAAGDSRLRLATLGGRLPAGQPICDADTWRDYRLRQGDWLIAPLIAEFSRQLTGTAASSSWTAPLGSDADAVIRAVARDRATASWPTAPPADADVLRGAVTLGRPAFDAAKAAVLHLLRLGYALARTVEDRNTLADLGGDTHGPFSDVRRADLSELVKDHLAAADPKSDVDTVVGSLTDAYVGRQGAADDLRTAWTALGTALDAATPVLARLCAATERRPAPPGARARPGSRSRESLRDRRTAAAHELRSYLRFFARTPSVSALLDLHVAVRSVQPTLLEVDQPVELIQVSADTRTALAPTLSSAASKLTGMQLHHFGAFYKASWRANDWMWGRLDGCGWLVHVLLDPARIIAVLENDGIATGHRAATFAARLAAALETAELPAHLLAGLAFLDDEAVPLPVSLPDLAMWAAAELQRFIATEELPILAQYAAGTKADPPSNAVRTWVAAYHNAQPAAGVSLSDAVAGKLLATCPVPRESLKQEADQRTPLFLRTATQSAAVATSSFAGLPQAQGSLRPALATARTITRTAYLATARTSGHSAAMSAVGAGLIAVGFFALLTNTAVFGLTGLVAFAAGTLLIAFAVGRTTLVAVQIVVALALVLLAAAPWLPWLDSRVFSWLTVTAIPWIAGHHWVWPVLLFLVLLPPLTALGGARRTLVARRSRRAAAAAVAPAVVPAAAPVGVPAVPPGAAPATAPAADRAASRVQA